jgi:small neutral amino acid transporter SnatA (MarC family)
VTTALLVVALLGTWNVFRLHPALPAGGRRLPERAAAVALGSVLTLVAMGVLAEVADDVLAGLEITPATARIAVGAVVALAACRDLLAAPPAPEPALRGVLAGVVPVFFPLLLSPPAGLLALSGAADHGLGTVLWASAVALLPVVAAALAPPAEALAPAAARVERGLHRVLAGVLVLAGLALVVDGIFDI